MQSYLQCLAHLHATVFVCMLHTHNYMDIYTLVPIPVSSKLEIGMGLHP